MDIQDILTRLKEDFKGDESLTMEVRTKLAELVDEVAKNPTQSNVEALTVVMETLSNAEKYMSAVSSLSGLAVNQAA